MTASYGDVGRDALLAVSTRHLGWRLPEVVREVPGLSYAPRRKGFRRFWARCAEDKQTMALAHRCAKDCQQYRSDPIAPKTERGLAALPYVATTINGVADEPPSPSKISDFDLVQIPPSLADGTDFNLVVLAARGDALTSRLDVAAQARLD